MLVSLDEFIVQKCTSCGNTLRQLLVVLIKTMSGDGAADGDLDS